MWSFLSNDSNNDVEVVNFLMKFTEVLDSNKCKVDESLLSNKSKIQIQK